MTFPVEQTNELKQYCTTLSSLTEAGVTYLHLEKLKLPMGCDPPECDALFCPAPKDGYSSRLYFEAQVQCGFARNWNASNVRIGERNWFAFSWRVELSGATLKELLIAHLNGFAKTG